MRILKKLTGIVCTLLLTITLLPTTEIVKATEEGYIGRQATAEEQEAILNGNYEDYVLQKLLHEGDEVISQKTIYVRINESNSNVKPEVITQNEYENEVPGKVSINISKGNIITPFGFTPGEEIPLADRWNWIKLSFSCTKLSTPINGNKYQFTARYSWKQNPRVIAFKDVFGIANDGNVVFDTSTFSGQAINPTTINPY